MPLLLDARYGRTLTSRSSGRLRRVSVLSCLVRQPPLTSSVRAYWQTLMQLQSAAVLLLLFFNWQVAAAKCVYTAACYQVSGLVAECDTVSVDGGSYFRLNIPEVEASVGVCPTPPDRVPEPGETQQAVSRLSSQHTFFVAKSGSSTCRSVTGTRIGGRVSNHCCDTTPYHGLCKLTAPLLLPAGE